MIVHGGLSTGKVFNDVWELCLRGPCWHWQRLECCGVANFLLANSALLFAESIASFLHFLM